MGLLSTALETRDSLENPSTSLVQALTGGLRSLSGVHVNNRTALRASGVFAAIRVLSETLASVPFPLYRRLDRGKKRAVDYPLYPLLHDNPNPDMTSYTWRETSMVHLCTDGNAFSWIERNNLGRPKAIWPLLPGRIKMERRGGRLWYRYYWHGDISDPKNPDFEYVPQEDMIHILGISRNGLQGLNLIRAIAIDVIGTSLAAQEYAARWYANSASNGAILKHPGNLSREAQENLKLQLQDEYAGLSQAHKVKVLEEGMELEELGFNPKDSQLLEARKFSVTEAARIWRVPPHMIGDLDRSTNNNIEQQSLEFSKYTMMPWFVKWEQETNRKVLRLSERSTYFSEFLVEGLLRADSKSRGEFYRTMFNIGAFTRDDIRERENMNPLPTDQAGDKTFIPLNMWPADQFGSQVTPQSGGGSGGQRARASLADNYEARALQMRRHLRNAYRPVLANEAGRMVRLEVNEIQKAITKFLTQRDQQQFYTWLETFYTDTFPGKLRDGMGKPLTAYGQAMAEEAGSEIDAEWSQASRDAFITSYIDAYVSRHVNSSRSQLEGLVAEAISLQEDPAAAAQQRLDEWEQTRPDKTAFRESVQMGEAVAREVFVSQGYRLKWRTIGKNCALCDPLDGMIVGHRESFVSQGTTWAPEGAPNPITVTNDVRHPQLHQGCDCSIVATQ